MLKYRKKPVVIEAMEYKGNADELPHSMWSHIGQNAGESHCYITTMEGTMRCEVGDYIIRDATGELSTCKAGVFAATHELVEDVK